MAKITMQVPFLSLCDVTAMHADEIHAAAAMMAGGAADGWYQWKDAENKTLHEVHRM